MAIPGAVIGALGSLASSLVSNRGALRRQQRADRENIRFWNMQNQYNHPLAQIERLKEAGLNPNLIYGSSVAGATGSAGSIAPSKAAPYNINNPVQSGISGMLAPSQKNNVDANTAKTLEDAGVSGLNKKLLAKNFNSLVEIQRLNVENESARLYGQELDNMLKGKTLDINVDQEIQKLVNLKATGQNLKLDAGIKTLQKDLAKQGITVNDNIIHRLIGLLATKFGIDLTPN